MGITIERKKIEVPESAVKMTGNYNVTVKLYTAESAVLKVTVAAADAKEE